MFPPHPLCKSDLRWLLTQRAQTDQADLTPAKLNAAQQWATMAGLVDQRGVTTVGRLVVEKDPYLETTVTDWLIHFHLSQNHQLWNDFVYAFLPNHPEFTQAELTHHFTEISPTETPKQLQKIAKLILGSYLDPQILGRHRFLDQNKKAYSHRNPDLSNPYTTAYILAKVWERDFGTQQSVLVTGLLDGKLSLSSLLGISREQLKQQFNALAKHEIIEQRSAKPHLARKKPQTIGDDEITYQVYRCWNRAEELLEQAYENDKAKPNRPLIQALESILDEEDEAPDFSQFLEWASELVGLGGGSKTITKLAS